MVVPTRDPVRSGGGGELELRTSCGCAAAVDRCREGSLSVWQAAESILLSREGGRDSERASLGSPPLSALSRTPLRLLGAKFARQLLSNLPRLTQVVVPGARDLWPAPQTSSVLVRSAFLSSRSESNGPCADADPLADRRVPIQSPSCPPTSRARLRSLRPSSTLAVPSGLLFLDALLRRCNDADVLVLQRDRGEDESSMLRARARERKPENEAVLDERDEGTKGPTVQRRGTEGLQVVHRERYEDKRGRKACTRRGETALSTSLLHRRRSHRRHLHRRSHHRRLLLLHIPLHQSYRHRTRRRRRRTLPSYRTRRSLPLHTLLRCKGDPVARQHGSRDV